MMKMMQHGKASQTLKINPITDFEKRHAEEEVKDEQVNLVQRLSTTDTTTRQPQPLHHTTIMQMQLDKSSNMED